MDQLISEKQELQRIANKMKKQVKDEEFAIKTYHLHAKARLSKVETNMRVAQEEGIARVVVLESKLKGQLDLKESIPIKYAKDMVTTQNKFDEDMVLVKQRINEALHIRDNEIGKAEHKLEAVTKQLNMKTDELDSIRRKSILK